MATSPTTTQKTKVRSQKPLWKQLEERWNGIQVGRQGSYSIERLDSLDEYRKTTSWIRVIWVCVFTPVPALVAAVVLECLPLRPPSEGWVANWLFFIRGGITQLIMVWLGAIQLREFVPGLNLTLWKQLVVAVGTSASFTGISLIAANAIGFPVPLMVQVGSIPVGIIIQIMLRIVLGQQVFASDSRFQVQIQRFNRFLFAHLNLFGLYPLYKVLYDAVPHHYRSVVVLVMTLWRFTAKHIMARATREVVDFMPQLVAFSVDFYGTLFITVCMFTAGSIHLSVLLMAADIAQTLLEFREARANATTLLQLIRARQESQHVPPRKNGQPSDGSDTIDLLEMILAVARNPVSFHVKSLENVRLRACVPQPLTRERENSLQILEVSGIYQRGELCSVKAIQPLPRRAKLGFRQVLVAPSPRNVLVTSLADSSLTSNAKAITTGSDELNVNSRYAEDSKAVVQQGLQLLFHCEYLALVEYVECIVPLVFVIFKSVLEQLPNIAYYPGGAGNWGVDTAAGILLFGAMEIISLVLFNAFVQRNFRFSALYQLAFVLETQFYLVQACLFTEIILLLQYELLHFGQLDPLFLLDFYLTNMRLL